MRLVAVLGFSSRSVDGLHPVCAARLHHAEQVVREDDIVLLSGWGRGRRGEPVEGELMRDAWRGPAVRLEVDPTAHNTRENAVDIAAAARRLGADEVLLVTSRWHAPRALALTRAALPGVTVDSSPVDGPNPLVLRARELACRLALPYQLRKVKSGGGGI